MQMYTLAQKPVSNDFTGVLLYVWLNTRSLSSDPNISDELEVQFATAPIGTFEHMAFALFQ